MYTQAEIDAHREMLEERVFQIDRKWPQFRRLLDDVDELARRTPPGARVVSLERGMLYGGISLLAPFFQRHDFHSVDCSPASAEGRGAYNRAMVDDPRCLTVATSSRGLAEQTGLASGQADLVIVANLVHHVRDQTALFAEIARLMKPGGRGYIFEPLVRELHQAPDDYVRYTPWGFAEQLGAAGLSCDRTIQEGGPFSVIAYCWTQALEYFPEAERADMERWFYDEHFPQLMDWDAAHRDNLARRHTSFPAASAIFFSKPACAAA